MTALDEPPAAEELDRWSRYSALTRDLFVTIGFDGVFRAVEGDVEGMLGWTAEQLRGRRFTQFLHPTEVGVGDDELHQLLAGGTIVEFTHRYRTKKREWRWLHWRAVGVPELELIYATAGPDAEKQLDLYSSELEDSLRVVTGFLELLERRYGDRLDEDGMQFVSAALSSARRIERLQG